MKNRVIRSSVAVLVAIHALSIRGQESLENYTIQLQMDHVSVLTGDRAFGLIMIDSVAELVTKHNAHWAIHVFTVERGKPTKVSKNPEQMQYIALWGNETQAAEVGREVAKHQFVTVFTPMESEFDNLNPRMVDLEVQAKLVVGNNEFESKMPSLVTDAPFATHNFRRAMRTEARKLTKEEFRQFFMKKNRQKSLADFHIDVPNWLSGPAESQYVIDSVQPNSTWYRAQQLVNLVNDGLEKNVEEIYAVLDGCGPAERLFNGSRLRVIIGDNPPPPLKTLYDEFRYVMIQE